MLSMADLAPLRGITSRAVVDLYAMALKKSLMLGHHVFNKRGRVLDQIAPASLQFLIEGGVLVLCQQHRVFDLEYLDALEKLVELLDYGVVFSRVAVWALVREVWVGLDLGLAEEVEIFAQFCDIDNLLRSTTYAVLAIFRVSALRAAREFPFLLTWIPGSTADIAERALELVRLILQAAVI